MITLYHGTNTPFDAIDLKQSKRYKDFNRAFYQESKPYALEANILDSPAFSAGLLGLYGAKMEKMKKIAK